MTNNSVRRSMATPIAVQTLPEEENKPALRRISGYALKFDNETYIGGKEWGFYEVIRKEALSNADLSDVVLCRNHDNSKTVARTSNGTLKLTVDDVGLQFIADVIDTTDGLDMMKEIESGLIGGMSFHARYDIDGCRMSEKDGKEFVEVVGYSKFMDVSPVTFPAYDDTEVALMRSRVAANSIAQREARLLARLDELVK